MTIDRNVERILRDAGAGRRLALPEDSIEAALLRAAADAVSMDAHPAGPGPAAPRDP